MKYLIVPLFFMAIFKGCVPVCCDPGPPMFGVIIRTSEGEDYLTANADKPIDIYYDGETNHNGWDDVYPSISSPKGDTTFLMAINVYGRRANGINLFYLNVGDDIDTLYIDIDKKKNKYTTVLFNGEPAKEINTSTGPYWLMIKK